MKTRTTAVLTALLAGAVTAGAHPYPYQQEPYRGRAPGPRQFENQRRSAQPCPVCGQRGPRHPNQRGYRQGRPDASERQGPPRFHEERRNAQPYGRRGQAVPQMRQRRYDTQQPREQWEQRRNPRLNQQQKERLKNQRCDILEHFDKDGDGRLSKEERRAARKAVQRLPGDDKPGEHTPRRQKEPGGEE